MVKNGSMDIFNSWRKLPNAWVFLLPIVAILLAAFPRPVTAQSAQELLFESLEARIFKKADILVHAEPLKAFGIEGTHYQIISLSDAGTCVDAHGFIVTSESVDSRRRDVCGVLGVHSLFSAKDIGVPLGVHRQARVILGPFGFFLLESPLLELPLVIHNELNPSLSATDILEAAAWSLSRNPEDFRFVSLDLASAWHPFEPGLSVMEWREWLKGKNASPFREVSAKDGHEEECVTSGEGVDHAVTSTFRCRLGCSSGGPGAMTCGCGGGGSGCLVDCHIGSYACCRCGWYEAGCFCCSSGTGGGGGGGGGGPGWWWPPIFDWPPYQPPPVNPL